MINTKIVLEERPYHEDASSEEIQAIRDRVIIYDPQIIHLNEIPVVSPFSIGLVFEQVELLGESLGAHGLIVDIRNTKRPDAITRRKINGHFKMLCEKLDHVSFCTGKNFLINTAARFVMHQTNLESFSINKTFEESVLAIKNKING